MNLKKITSRDIMALIALSITGLELPWYCYPILGIAALYLSVILDKKLRGLYQHPSEKEFYNELRTMDREKRRGKRSSFSLPLRSWIVQKFKELKFAIKKK